MIDFSFLQSIEDKRSSLRATYPDRKEYVIAVSHAEYICRVGEIIAKINPARYLTIGWLWGTTESYAMQCCGWRPEKIAVIDIDSAQYNPDRDSGSFCYRNICGTKYSSFDGDFSYIRHDSQRMANGKVNGLGIGYYDCIFLDGEHTAAAIEKDLTNSTWLLSLKKDACIIVHDIELDGSDVGVGYNRWLESHQFWQHKEFSSKEVLHGLGIIWR